MKWIACLLAATVLGAVPGAVSAKGPVVVELFTAQGCASCRKADRLIAQMAERPGLIVLTWAVDYWDYLGWKDTFAQPEFAARQRAFARHLGPQDVYTPQVIVGGASQASGDDAAGVEALIRKALRDADRRRRARPRIRFLGRGLVRIGAGRSPGARDEVWLVRYDPHEQNVTVTAGDNSGATVAEGHVVKQVVRLGAWGGRPITIKTPAPTEEGLESVVLVQAPRGGPVLTAASAHPSGR
jgi:hypothetical protein